MKQAIFLFFVLITAIVDAQEFHSIFKDWQFSSDSGKTWNGTLPQEMGVYELRFEIEVDDSIEKNKLYGLGVSMLATSDVYWDDKYLGGNGKVGSSKEQEIPGTMMSMYVVPNDLLAKGKHKVRIKFSNFHCGNKMRYYGISLLPYEKTLLEPIILTAYVHIYAGCFLIIGLFYLVRFFVGYKNKTNLFFSLLCLGFFLLMMVEYSKNYYLYLYPFHFIRLRIILGLTIFIGLCMPLYYLFRLDLVSKIKYLLIPVLLYTFLAFTTQYGYDFATNLIMVSSIFASSIICIKAILKQRRRSVLLLLSVLPLCFMLLIWRDFYDAILYIGFGNLILLNLISLALQEAEIRKERESALLVSSRLRLDLLRKNIQPHFINNSITSAIDWIERNPQKGVDFLFALSKEFDILNDISERKLIPIIKEIELCRAHLEIMSFRKEEEYELITRNIDQHDIVPPAIFLTLVENGISHKNSKTKSMKFFLSYSCASQSKVYELLAESEVILADSDSKSGTGFKYIRARLEESYPSKWSFTSAPSEKGWLSRIEIKI